MAGNATETRDVFCDFCKKPRIQVGELSCLHRMCANCFPFYSKKLDKCYLCVLATADVKRTSMKIIKGSVYDSSYTLPEGEEFFCPKNDCPFIGTMMELITHKVVCNLTDSAVADRKESSASPDFSVPAQRDALKSSRFLELLDVAVDAWNRAKPAFRVAGEESDRGKISDLYEETLTEPNHGNGLSKELHSCIIAKLLSTVAPKYSVEISDFVELSRSPESSETSFLDRSTPEIAATKGNVSYSVSRGDLCEGGGVLNSSTCSVAGPADNDCGWEAETEELSESGEAPNDPANAVSLDSSRYTVGEDPEVHDTATNHSLQPCRKIPDSYIHLIIGLLLAIAMVSITNVLARYREIDSRSPVIQDPGASEGYITWTMDNVSDVVARARFNKRHLRTSQFSHVRNYLVRLGVGATFSVDDNVVIVWMSAVVMKDDERVWPSTECMQLRLEHEDPALVLSYVFKSSHKGNWREHKRNERKSITYRQLQVETTERLKYMRFSYFLTYDDAVAKGYINNDSISVGFKLLPYN